MTFYLATVHRAVTVCPLAAFGSLSLYDHSLVLQDGETALHYACRGKRLEVAKWLAEQMTREAALGLNKVSGSSAWLEGIRLAHRL